MNEFYEFESWDKLDEIRLILNRLNVRYVVHRHDDEEFSYLNDNEICVKIPNPYTDDTNRTVFIDLQDEISLFFGAEWHAHYYLTEEDYREFCETLSGFMKNELCSAAVFIGEDLHWGGSMLADRKSVSEKSAEEIFAGNTPSDANDFKQSWEEKGAEVRFRFWNPKDDKMVVFERKR
ncbi:MAG: hypothetical protein K2N06_10185 [Oscillospiraceae bacterium]|nr:hypothetical protein [Oscillospiraceae bacterium]